MEFSHLGSIRLFSDVDGGGEGDGDHLAAVDDAVDEAVACDHGVGDRHQDVHSHRLHSFGVACRCTLAQDVHAIVGQCDQTTKNSISSICFGHPGTPP